MWGERSRGEPIKGLTGEGKVRREKRWTIILNKDWSGGARYEAEIKKNGKWPQGGMNAPLVLSEQGGTI